MTLPSQTARPSGSVGRSFSSRRRRKRMPTELMVIGGGLVLLGLGVYGLMWAFGAFADEPQDAQMPLVNEEQSESMLPRAIRDPMGAHPSIITQGSGGAKPEVVSAAGSAAGDEQPPRRNLLRESLEQQAALNQSTPGGGVDPTPASEVLATNRGGGANPPEQTPPPSAPIAAVPGAIAEAERLVQRNDPVGARQVLSDALRDRQLSEAQRRDIRERLAALNADLVFGAKIVSGDPLTESYEVQAGDRLAKIAQRRELATHWKLIQRVNGLSNPNQIRVGQKLKLVRGPFHVIVDKSEYRLDLYHGQPSAPETWLFIRSFRVGLGKDDGTPLGNFVVMRGSKVEDPSWVNPTNPAERYASKDPKNPLGKFWIGIEGLGDSAGYVGYGIHGTIEPDTIGTQASLGCVRLGAEDIALLYELLEEGISLVRIVP